MIQEFVLEVIHDVSFYEWVKTKKGTVRRLRHKKGSDLFKLHGKTLKSIQKEIDLILGNYRNFTADWKIYTSFPFE